MYIYLLTLHLFPFHSEQHSVFSDTFEYEMIEAAKTVRESYNEQTDLSLNTRETLAKKMKSVLKQHRNFVRILSSWSDIIYKFVHYDFINMFIMCLFFNKYYFPFWELRRGINTNYGIHKKFNLSILNLPFLTLILFFTIWALVSIQHINFFNIKRWTYCRMHITFRICFSRITNTNIYARELTLNKYVRKDKMTKNMYIYRLILMIRSTNIPFIIF